MIDENILLTVVLNTVDHDLAEGPSPSSLWISAKVKKVLDGGPFPEEATHSFCLAKGITLEDAEQMQAGLMNVLAHANLTVGTEFITDD